MRRTVERAWPRVLGAIATIALMHASTTSVDARTVRTPSLAQEPDGYVYCKVVGTSRKPIGIIAGIRSDGGTDVTEFGYGSRVTTEDGFDAEETAGSFHGESQRYYCRVTVTGARKKDVRASLTAYDKDGVTVATVEAR